MTYSQGKEEEVLTKFFAGQKGRFLDIGAWEGKTFSNTRRLFELGWGGVCVEPCPVAFSALLKLYMNNPQVMLVNCAIALESKMRWLYQAKGDAVSSLNSGHVARWEKHGHVTFRKMLIKTITIPELFVVVGCNFKFISLDVEGNNLGLFKQIPLKDMPATKAVCIEHDTHYKDILNIVKPLGFRELFRNGENLIVVR